MMTKILHCWYRQTQQQQQPKLGFFSRLLNLGGGSANSGAANASSYAGSSGGSSGRGSDGKLILYFGLFANTAQETVVERLDTHGCVMLVGTLGISKSQTIAN